MAEELYAQKLDISDDRVKEVSIAEADFSVKAYAESAALFPADAGVKVADSVIRLEAAKELNLITKAQYEKSPSTLSKLSQAELTRREAEALAVKEDAAKTSDVRAAAEILEKVSQIKRAEQVSIKYYAPNYFEHLVRAIKVTLIKRDESISKEKEKELDRRAIAVKTLNQAFITKYSKTQTFADRLRSISDAATAKKLAAPVVQDAGFKYEGK